MFPSEERESHKKAIGYLSYYAHGLFTDSIRMALTISDKSFRLLPEELQQKFLDTAHEVADYLKHIKASSLSSSKNNV